MTVIAAALMPVAAACFSAGPTAVRVAGLYVQISPMLAAANMQTVVGTHSGTLSMTILPICMIGINKLSSCISYTYTCIS